MSILEINNLGINFGGLRAVSEFNLSINENELVGLIGPNGAGKTTVFNMLTGVYQPTEGDITLNGKSILNRKPNAIAQMGIARTFQNIRLFKEMTVLDNTKLALHHHYNYSLLSSIIRLPRFFRDEKAMDEEALRLLSIFDLKQYAARPAKNLPYGKQRELEIVRALAMRPKVLLLDEPAAGMNPQETLSLMHTIKRIKEEFNISVLLIEHDMKLVMGICERITVLNYGLVLATGTPSEIQENAAVIKAYLGG